ncbi:MAG: transcriptional regulator GlxA family with amidase domain [Paracoccaceae bacterium]|jgi:transcriptional regulator GlxA family with amidase domain
MWCSISSLWGSATPPSLEFGILVRAICTRLSCELEDEDQMRDYVPQLTKSFAFFIQDGFPLSSLSSLIDPLRSANETSGEVVFSWIVVSETGEPVQSSANLDITPNCSLADMTDPDVLIILADPTSIFANAKSTTARLRRLDRAGVILGGASGGVFSLARAGVMAGHKSSVHWCYQAVFKEEFPHLECTNKVMIQDRRRITASGSTAVFELALNFIERTISHEVMTEVACWFQHPSVRSDEADQMHPTINQGFSEDSLPYPVISAIKLFRENVEEPLQISSIAEELGVSCRQLERCFMETTGCSPRAYYYRVRLRVAKQLVTHSNHSISRVANLTGFRRRSDFINRYLQVFGEPPSKHQGSVNHFHWRKSSEVAVN